MLLLDLCYMWASQSIISSPETGTLPSSEKVALQHLGMPILNGKFSPSPCTSCTRALEEARVLGMLYHCQQTCNVLLSCQAARSALQEFEAWLKFLDHNGEGPPQATVFFFKQQECLLQGIQVPSCHHRGLCQRNQVLDYPQWQPEVPFLVLTHTDPMW